MFEIMEELLATLPAAPPFPSEGLERWSISEKLGRCPASVYVSISLNVTRYRYLGTFFGNQGTIQLRNLFRLLFDGVTSNELL